MRVQVLCMQQNKDTWKLWRVKITVSGSREKQSVEQAGIDFFEIQFVNGTMNCDEKEWHFIDQRLWRIRAATLTIPAPANWASQHLLFSLGAKKSI